MLQDAVAKKIAQLLRLPEDEFLTALKSDKEETVEISDKLTVLDEDGVKKMEKNHYNKGKNAGIEMAIKDYAKENDIEITGKTVESLAEAITSKALEEAGKDVPEQVKQAQAALKKVQTEYKALQQTVTEKEAAIANAQGEASLYREVPALEEGMLPVNKMVTLMKAEGYEFVNVEGKMVAKKDGEVVTNNLGEPVSIKDVMTDYSTTNKLHTPKSETPPPPKGRNAGNATGTTTFTRLSELKASFESQGKSTQGTEFTNAVRAARKDNDDFDIDS